MTTKEQVQDYLARSGDEKITGERIIEDENGFMTYWVRDGIFYLGNVYGNGKYWDKIYTRLAKELGCKKIQFATRRNPKAFERKYNFEMVGYIMEKGV